VQVFNTNAYVGLNVDAGLLVLLHWSCELILWVCHCVHVSHMFRYAITICHEHRRS